MIKTPSFQCRDLGDQSLLEQLRCCHPFCVAQKTLPKENALLKRCKSIMLQFKKNQVFKKENALLSIVNFL